LSPLDYIVIAAYVLGVTAIGFFASGRRQTSLSGYLIGDRAVPWLAGAASLIATGVSTKSLIGMPGLAYSRDLTYLQMYLVLPLGALVAATVFLPFYSRLRITSAYEYLGRRFSPAMQSYASLLFQFETAFVVGTVIAAPSLVMSEATGISYEISVAVLLGATVLYTTFGGMKAVIWTDVVQFAIFAVTPIVLLAFIVGSAKGGLGELIEVASAHGKLKVFDFSYSLTAELTFWGAIGSMFFWHAGNQCVNQVLIQRYMTAPSQADSRKAILVGAGGILLLWMLFLFLGVILYAMAQQRPGAVPAGLHPDRVFTAFVMSSMPEGLRGCFIAAAFAAGMSTLSSMLNSMSTVTLLDVWKLHFNDEAGERVWLRRARMLTIMWGAFSFGAALIVLQFGTVITAGIKFGSMITGALLGIFLLGIFVKRAGVSHAVAGSVIGMASVGAVMIASDISWSWYCGIGTVMTFVPGLLLALLTPSKRDVRALSYSVLIESN